MTPILAALPLIIQAVPSVEAGVSAAKAWISSLIGSSQIDAASQDALHAHVDAIASALASGQTPPEFQVQADPV